MKSRPRVHEAAVLRDLARAVIAQAIRDLKASDLIKKLDAFLWLTSNDFRVWADAMGAPFMDPFQMLSIGGARKLRGKP
jgi:hypothetical protein